MTSQHFTITKQVTFIDSSLPDYDILVDGLADDMEVILVSSDRDGVQVMAEWAATHSGYSTVHVLGHGSAGAQQLGTSTLSSDTLSQYQAQLSQIGTALTEDGDILLYGCNVAADQNGVDFIGKLAKVTGADIAVSDDLTGAESLGGDWRLEVTSGDVEANSIELKTYDGVLIPLNVFDLSNAIQIQDGSQYKVQQTVDDVTLTISSDAGDGSSYNIVSSGFNSGGISGNFYWTYSLSAQEVTLTFSKAVTVASLSGTFGGVEPNGGSGPFIWTISNGSQNVQATVTSSLQVTDFDLSSLGEVTQLTITSNVTTGHDFAIDSIQFEETASDTTAPVFESSTPSVSNISTTTVNLATDIDEAGKVYYIVVADGSQAPTAAQVKAGVSYGDNNGRGATVITSGNATVSSGDFSNTFNITGLTANTSYDIYVVAQDDEGAPNLQSAVTKVDAATIAPANNAPTISSAPSDISVL